MSRNSFYYFQMMPNEDSIIYLFIPILAFVKDNWRVWREKGRSKSLSELWIVKMSTSSAVFTLSLGFSYPELNWYISKWLVGRVDAHGCFIRWQWHRANTSDSVELSRKETIYEGFVWPALCRHLPVFTTLFSPLKRSKSSQPSSSSRYKYESRLHVLNGLLIIFTSNWVFIIIFQLIVKNVDSKSLKDERMKERNYWTIDQ